MSDSAALAQMGAQLSEHFISTMNYLSKAHNVTKRDQKKIFKALLAEIQQTLSSEEDLVRSLRSAVEKERDEKVKLSHILGVDNDNDKDNDNITDSNNDNDNDNDNDNKDVASSTSASQLTLMLKNERSSTESLKQSWQTVVEKLLAVKATMSSQVSERSWESAYSLLN